MNLTAWLRSWSVGFHNLVLNSMTENDLSGLAPWAISSSIVRQLTCTLMLPLQPRVYFLHLERSWWDECRQCIRQYLAECHHCPVSQQSQHTWTNLQGIKHQGQVCCQGLPRIRTGTIWFTYSRKDSSEDSHGTGSIKSLGNHANGYKVSVPARNVSGSRHMYSISKWRKCISRAVLAFEKDFVWIEWW